MLMRFFLSEVVIRIITALKVMAQTQVMTKFVNDSLAVVDTSKVDTQFSLYRLIQFIPFFQLADFANSAFFPKRRSLEVK